MCQAFLPIMRAEGRIVNVSSASGQLQQFGQALQSRFRNPEITLEALEALAQEYEVSLQVHGTLVNFSRSCCPSSLHYLYLGESEVQALNNPSQTESMRGTATKQGWARKPYFVSKALETTMTIALARENPAYYINACCPGWVNTDLGNQAGNAPKTVGKRKFALSFIWLRLPAP